ncbi:MAG: hypothetical protein JW866_10430, partial [Ignavibacteriales bacterium]|nr:hypothetical protein [Ignavibacteriales bacterium]
LEWKPSPQLSISFGPSYGTHTGKFQWVGKFIDSYATETYGTRYVVSNIDNQTISANLRVNWTFNPTMSLQVYIQPYFSIGEYSEFKEIAKPRSTQFNVYGENGSTITYDEVNSRYIVDPDGAGPASQFAFRNPNFNFKSFKANLVYRWEILPGSVLYLVWSHGQMDFQNPGDFSMGRDFKNLMSAEADDVFLAKFSYWFDI